ncbi:MAG: inositol monophosphatase [Candidatus Paceibacterota bacterium]|jgi:myo-inositol-1(or 4)-monophosphatase
MTKKDKENLIRAAHSGGRVLRKYFGKTLNPVEKSTLWDFQTEADLGSEKAILKVLKKEFPKYNIHAEEEGKTDNGSAYTIVVDPLDGTNNFLLGIPNFSVSIGLLYKDTPVAGIIYQPILKQTFYAEKGKGAWLNNKKIRASGIRNKNKITIAYSCGYKTSRSYLAKILTAFINHPHKRLALNWSMANDYCLLASGKIESMITDPGCPIYDYAAGKLIALEAGAVLTDLNGKKEIGYLNDNFLLSNNKVIHNYVLKIYKSVNK